MHGDSGLAGNVNRKILDLIEFQENVEKCEKCFGNTGRKVLFGSGDHNARIMCVGESPSIVIPAGTNIPVFGNKSNVYYERFLKAIGESRETVWTTNCAKCALVGVRPGEVRHCAGFIAREIEIIDPKIVITFGRPARNTIFPSHVDWCVPRITSKRKYLAMVHPMSCVYSSDGLETFDRLTQLLKVNLESETLGEFPTEKI